MNKIIIYKVAIRLLVTYFLMSEYHLDGKTIDKIIEVGSFYLDSLASQLAFIIPPIK